MAGMEDRRPISYSARAHRVAAKVADRTANRRFNEVSEAFWLVTYRTTYEVLAAEPPAISRRFAAALVIASLGIGLVLRSVL